MRLSMVVANLFRLGYLVRTGTWENLKENDHRGVLAGNIRAFRGVVPICVAALYCLRARLPTLIF